MSDNCLYMHNINNAIINISDKLLRKVMRICCSCLHIQMAAGVQMKIYKCSHKHCFQCCFTSTTCTDKKKGEEEMSSVIGVNCGCKGIRTCLLCGKESGIPDSCGSEQAKYIYTYCSQCNLCWLEDEDVASPVRSPLYFGKLNVFLNFITEEEEADLISGIDKLEWMPSQSGRRKQDFGPKVNFKKKKMKIGEFRGFPKFTENILNKFKGTSDLSDFQAVELCHLEYSPERGSSIDPHVDDVWLWGERLVTVNLGSSTVLTLRTFSKNACECTLQSRKLLSKLYVCKDHKEVLKCHKNPTLRSDSNSLSSNSTRDSNETEVENDLTPGLLESNKNHVTSICNDERKVVPCSADYKNAVAEKFESSSLANQCRHSNDRDSKFSFRTLAGNLEANLNEDESNSSFHPCHVNHDSECDLGFSALGNETPYDGTGRNMGDVCSEFRLGVQQYEVAVRVVLPPRSLLVLGGCSRYNWFHEIKRQDVVSRRLAMTFRELTPEFLEGGDRSELGKELLSRASRFCDFC